MGELARDVQTLRANSHVQLTEASVMNREGKPKFGTYDHAESANAPAAEQQPQTPDTEQTAQHPEV